MQARHVEQATLPEPRLDLRDAHGDRLPFPQTIEELLASAVLIDDRAADTTLHTVREINKTMQTGGTLLLSTPVSDSVETTSAEWGQRLNRSGFEIKRWQPYYDDNARHASNLEARDWSQWLFELTGHHTLPWRSLLDPIDAALRPHYEQTDRIGGHYLLIVATKAESAPVEQQLPPLTAWKPPDSPTPDSSTDTDAPSDAPQPPPISELRSSAVKRRSARTVPSVGSSLAALAFVSALLAQFAMRTTPTEAGSGTLWWLIALAALFGLRQLSAEKGPNRSFNGLSQWLQTLPWMQIATVGASVLVSAIAYTQAERPLVALPLWLIAIVATATALFHFQYGTPVDSESDTPETPATDGNTPEPDSSTLDLIRSLLTEYGVPLILFAALLIRVYQLAAHPWVLSGAEAQLGLEAINVKSIFSTAWLSNPTLPLFFTKASIAIFGRTTLALRFLAPIIGTATVFVTYQIGKRLWGQAVGIVAAILLAGSHFHIHYSRLGMTNIWDALLATLAMGWLAVAWHSEKRNDWLIAGLGIGLSAYAFTSAHLLPLMLVALLILTLLIHRGGMQAQWRNIVAAAALALVIALPQALFFNARPELFMERADLLGIQRNGWLAAEAISQGVSESAVLRQQLWQAALGFTAMIDKDGLYSPGVPLVNVLTGTFALLGIGMAIFHLRQQRYAVLLITIGITMLFGGALLVEVPHSRRYLIALPAVLLLAARALVWLVSKISTHSRTAAASYALQAAFIVATILALLDVGFYFGRYENSHSFADRNTELAHEMAVYLNELDGEWTAYFHGAPSMYISFSTLPYLATEFEANINLFDVLDTAMIPPANSANVVHIFVPERSSDLGLIQAIRPNGTTIQIDGFKSTPLFFAYESAP